MAFVTRVGLFIVDREYESSAAYAIVLAVGFIFYLIMHY